MNLHREYWRNKFSQTKVEKITDKKVKKDHKSEPLIQQNSESTL
jgi:hypothetical protein